MGHHLSSDSFIPTFIPEPEGKPKRPPTMTKKLADLIDNASSEKQIAAAWEEWLNHAKGPCPGYRIGLSQDTSALKDKVTGEKDKQGLKVDAALYKEEDVPTDGRPYWETSRLLIEFKRGGGQHDPYDDKTGDGASETRTDVRGQITTYVANAFSLQHRVAMFFLLVNGNHLRVTRWDRSGTVFTESFKYTQERIRLRNVLWNFSRLDAGKQGFDTTAILLIPGSEEYEFMDKLTRDVDGTDISEVEGTIVTKAQEHYTFRFVREAFAKSIAKGIPRYCLTVPVGNKEHHFLVGKATFTATGMTGRGTRGFIAWDVSRKRFAFLKDAWRANYQNVATEGRVLRDLRSTGVENTPTYVCDAELPDVTKTPFIAYREQPVSGSGQSQASGSGASKKRKKTPCRNTSSKASVLPDVDVPITPRQPTLEDFKQERNVTRYFRHYRVVVEEVCLGLEHFTTGKQLISIMRDCVKAHEGAATKTKILHRDISSNNILICPRVEPDEKGVLRVKWRGMLADWELSKPIAGEDDVETARQVVRTGTWQYASAYILDNPEKPVQIADEIESFYHVTLHNALRYLRHTCKSLQYTMFDYFDQYSFEEGQYRCGSNKRDAVVMGVLPRSGPGAYCFLGDDGLRKSQPINVVFTAMLRWFKARYKMLLETPDWKTEDAEMLQKLDEVAEDEAAGEQGDKEQGTTQEKEKRAADSLAVDSDAKFLNSHTKLLSLFDSALSSKFQWPTGDVVGDQLKDEPSKSDEEVNDEIGNSHESGAGDSNENGADEPDADEPKAKRQRSRANTKGKQRVSKQKPIEEEEEPIEEEPPEERMDEKTAEGSRRTVRRTRGTRTSRTTRGSSSRSTSMYNLRRSRG
ncbi:hypothetical protein L226DRAFT_617055 [Lentinus tigrinus ALCF2SS1-7]|uniref:Fungal-type protein kinase domain-containing protein n=1 Tax=Lentinus tigrinus ALCF2SS1-6 TaxID=1328759 RepID=A0A5C2RW85_9APHY|nr:hypothetical protein L227DRAFT_532829 [Lentinus tigrinus ALCF2SS1-6]RPD69072.1 hypothetical protein L226DRAFT_617055 [Lentinus tigrinus ALCF2SS1-7]